MSGLLVLDQATVTGWAFCDPGKEPLWGSIRLGKRGAWEGIVFWEFRNFLLDRIGVLQPDVLAFEAPFVPRPDRKKEAKPLSVDQLRRGFGLVSHITSIAEECGIKEIDEYQSIECVKFFTGRGRFPGETAAERTANKKEATVAACRARGWLNVTYDESDALALLMFAEWKRYPQAALSRRLVLKSPTGTLLQSLLTTP
jgi:hypothetical protein